MSLSVKTSLQSAIAAWSPYTDTDVKKVLAQVQKNAARFVCCDYKLTTGVEGLGWDTLGNRRLLNQSALFCKFHHKLWETLYSYIKKISLYQHLCCIVSLIASFFSIKFPIFAVFIHISQCFFCVLVQLLSVRLYS